MRPGKALCRLVAAVVAGVAAFGQDPANRPAPVAERIRSVLDEQARFEHGQPTAWLAAFQQLLQEAHRNPEEARAVEGVLVDFIGSGASEAARKLVADDVAPLVSEISLQPLVRMAGDPRTAGMALGILQRADLRDGVALAAALDRVPAAERATVVRHLGRRRDPENWPVLEGLAGDADPRVASAAVEAIARFGTRRAAAWLEREQERRGGPPDAALAEAMLTCAEGLAAAGEAESARALYVRGLAASLPDPLRVAAELGLLRLAPDPWGHLADRLRNAEPTLRPALRRAVAELPQKSGAARTLLASTGFADDERRHLLRVLAERGDPAVLADARRLVGTADGENLDFALRALAAAGGAEDVRPLVRRAVADSGERRRRIELTLAAMPAAGVDGVLTSLLDDPTAEVRRVVLAVVRERGTPGLEDQVRALTEVVEETVRTEAVRTYGVVAGPGALGTALARLRRAVDAAERSLWERAVYQLARKQADPDGPTEAVLAALGAARDETTAISLIGVLGGLKNPADLPALRRHLRDERPGVRLRVVATLGQWPDGAPADDLAALFAECDASTLRLEALRGAVRLVGADRRLGNAAKRERLEWLLARARDATERAVVVSGFGAVRDLPTLRLLVSYLADPGLAPGAQTGIRQIVREFETSGNPEVRELLLGARAQTGDDDFRAWLDEGLRRGRFDR